MRMEKISLVLHLLRCLRGGTGSSSSSSSSSSVLSDATIVDPNSSGLNLTSASEIKVEVFLDSLVGGVIAAPMMVS